jgi:hypothetical protein
MKTFTAGFRESQTFKFCTIAFVPVFLRYLCGGLVTSYGSVPIMSATEFATAFAAIMAVWLAREWRVTHYAGES